MIISHCSHCDYTPCRCSPEAIEKRSRGEVWLSKAEVDASERLYKERKQDWLRSCGLDWVIDFCSPSNKD